MTFIAQLNLADIAGCDEERLLPHSGLLSFFCAIDGLMASLDDPSSWMVSHFDGDLTTLVQFPFPSDLPERLQFPACQVRTSRELTLPDSTSRTILDLALSEQERVAYIDVMTGADIGFSDDVFTHHLLGYPYSLNDSPLIAGYLHAHGIADPYAMVPHLEDADLRRELSLRLPQHKWTGLEDLRDKADKEWTLLLQVYSNDEVQMSWGGGGVLHFSISREALSRRDFGHVWTDMQFV